MRLPKHKTCAACLWYAAAKQTANGVIDGEFFCRHAANSHKSKGWGGRVHKNDRACLNRLEAKDTVLSVSTMPRDKAVEEIRTKYGCNVRVDGERYTNTGIFATYPNGKFEYAFEKVGGGYYTFDNYD